MPRCTAAVTPEEFKSAKETQNTASRIAYHRFVDSQFQTVFTGAPPPEMPPGLVPAAKGEERQENNTDTQTFVGYEVHTMASSSDPTSGLSKKRKLGQDSITISAARPLILTEKAHDDDNIEDADPQAMAQLLFRQRTRTALYINPSYIRMLKNHGVLGYHPSPANKTLAFTTFEINIAEFRRCITQVLTRALEFRYYDRSNLRDSEITAELARIVPLTVSACMCAVYAKLHAIHCQHGRLATRYSIIPRYDKEIELPLPLAAAIQELGMFQTANLPQNAIYAPTYPEATQYEGREHDAFNIIDYIMYIPTFRELGIPCKPVDANIVKGSAWWIYKVFNYHNTSDLLCLLPPSCYTDLDVSLRMLFLANGDDSNECSDFIMWPAEHLNFGTHLREVPPNYNTRAFLALCHGPKEEWST